MLTSQQSAENILCSALDVAEAMLRNGAEVYRVEDTIVRICAAYGMQRTDAFAIPNSIVVSVTTRDGIVVTQTRRILHNETNLEKVDKLNQLSRDVCRKLPNTDSIREWVKRIDVPVKESPIYLLLAYALGSCSFTALFKGSWNDILSTALCAMVFFIIERPTLNLRINKMLRNLLSSSIFAAMAFLCTRTGLGTHVDKIVIGEIMLLIPGLEFTTGMRDLMAGDTIAGLSHLCEAVCVAVAIAAGAAGMLALLGGLAA